MMAMKHISDAQVLHAMIHHPYPFDMGTRVYLASSRPWALTDYLHEMTGQPHKVCSRAAQRTMEKACHDWDVLNEWGIDALNDEDREIYVNAMPKA